MTTTTIVQPTPVQHRIEARECKGMKRGPRYALLDDEPKKCRREIFPAVESDAPKSTEPEETTDGAEMTCIDQAIDTGDVEIVRACLEKAPMAAAVLAYAAEAHIPRTWPSDQARGSAGRPTMTPCPPSTRSSTQST